MKGKDSLLNILDNGSADKQVEDTGRRDFLKVLGGAAVAGAVGCADSATQNIYPHLKGENTQVPGEAVWYNSTCTQCSAGCGVMVRTREGRAVKIEGNPEHPVNRGALCALGHSALQDHYDPDRVRQPLERQQDGSFKPISWAAAKTKVKRALTKKGKKSFITAPLSGSLQKLVSEWTKEHVVQHQSYTAMDQVALAQASELVYGHYGIPSFKLDQADTIVNFGADFLETWINPTGYAKDWAKTRKGHHPVRTIQVEPRLSLTGANSDHWLSCKPGTEISVALGILKELVSKGNSDASSLTNLVSSVSLEEVYQHSGVKVEKILFAASKLHESKHSLVLAGSTAASGSNGLALQVVVALINRVLGNVGHTVKLQNMRTPQSSVADIKKLIQEIQTGDHTVMLVDGSNPAFTLPSSFQFDLAIKKLDLLVSFASHIDDTTKHANLILPASTSLESWGDSYPYEGLYNLIQPAMNPVFDTQALGDSLLATAKKDSKLSKYEDYKAYLKENWKEVQKKVGNSDSFEKFWDESVEQGGRFEDSPELSLKAINPKVFQLTFRESKFNNEKLKESSDLVLYPYPSVKTFDGRAANRPWMQETPDPMTQVAWDTWAEIHPDTAKKIKVNTGDLIKVKNYYGELKVSAYVTEYVNKGVVAVPIGNGHEAYGRYAESVKGGNVYDLLPAQESDHDGLALLASKVLVSRTLGKRDLVVTQESHDQHGRHLARTRFADDHGHGDDHHGGHHGGHHEAPQMYEQRVHPVYRWGMAVDLAACTGCSACVVACYAENNIPTVGKEVMLQGREMSWLRIERYDDGSAEELQVSFLPMMCQHCNNAPCEPVCPVYATYHNEEGLNAMIYNRCVGTRYCANNCTYKVRRFNWFEFDFPEPLDWQLNPDTMRRSAGVMEKCSFCVQRISAAKDHAKDEGRLVKDGEIQPACVQSCPTEALAFGDLNDPNSKVSKMSHDERAYKVLDHHLNTQPAISYLDNVKYKA